MQGLGPRVQGFEGGELGFSQQGTGFAGFRVQGSLFRVQGLGCKSQSVRDGGWAGGGGGENPDKLRGERC